jgi:uncharacterized coiled-coil protein SlyX
MASLETLRTRQTTKRATLEKLNNKLAAYRSRPNPNAVKVRIVQGRIDGLEKSLEKYDAKIVRKARVSR